MVDWDALRELIRLGGFATQKNFAAAVGLNGPKLSAIMAGRRSVSLEEACRMAIALRTDLESIAQVLGCLPAP